ncbi:unnamed protein product [Trifolium pratense]|uniref:Uncharacterized protein n=1 Tax=Trifolium pratense TaxID=57577 RepID=A0ACB0KRE5_TRIPR|nr:unnamed protein product [Trifolium pratense]
MELDSSSSLHLNQSNVVDATGNQVSRNNSRGIRVIGNRIYDSENGKSCHQCRQKTRDFSAGCKNPRNGKPCLIRFCHKCLLNRYGEKAEEVDLLNDWNCPKCKGICNCSLCMKKRGQQPTGILVHTAKASGFNSVSEMLSKKTSEGLELNNSAVLPIKEATLEKELVVHLSEEPGEENSLSGKKVLKVENEKTKKMKRGQLKEISNGNSVDDACQNNKLKKPKLCNGVSDCEVKRNANAEMEPKVEENHGMIRGQIDGPVVMGGGDNASAKSQTNPIVLHAQKIKEEVPLPIGTVMINILDIEFAPEDVGNALQFLEFCRVFGKALDVKKGEAEAILRALIRKQSLRRGQNNSVVEFQIKLLTLIVSESETDSSSLTASDGKDSWLTLLKDLITESDLGLKEFPLDWLDKGISGYNDLDISKKLIILNFICDEALGTMNLRSYIDDQNAKIAEEKKAAKSKVAEAKEKERSLKQQLQDEMAKAVISNGASLSISECDALVSKIKSEAAKAHSELLEAKGTIPKRNQCCDAVRIEPEYFDNSGKAFWQLRSCNDEYVFLLQDVTIHDEGVAELEVNEKWFVYGAEQKDGVNKYISSKRDWFPKLVSV